MIGSITVYKLQWDVGYQLVSRIAFGVVLQVEQAALWKMHQID